MGGAGGEQTSAGIKRELLQYVAITNKVYVGAPGRRACVAGRAQVAGGCVAANGVRQYLDGVIAAGVEATHGIAIDYVNGRHFSAEDQFVRELSVHIRHD